MRNILNKILKSQENHDGVKPMGVITTVPRPESPVNKLSDEERRLMNEKYKQRKEAEQKLDAYFIQEISDRLYGPDSDEYISALRELNQKFRPRKGRTGPHIFRD